jgi:hypothetical protein
MADRLLFSGVRPMSCPRGSFVAVALSGAMLGCSASVPPKPVGLPPTPQTVTVANPGGDASDPEWAALDRLAREPWASRRDRTGTLFVPLVDARHWTRVRLWGYPTRASFRYGDDHYGIVSIWYKPSKEPDPESCLAAFVNEARPVAEAFGARVLGSRLMHLEQRMGRSHRPMVVQVIDAEVPGLLSDRSYAGALASYRSWPGTCLIQGFVVSASNHRELAGRIRDRWVAEGASRLAWQSRLLEAPVFDDK